MNPAARLRDAGLPTCAFVVVGFPNETLAAMRRTVDFVASLLERKLLHASYLYVLVPYPGTPMYHHPDRYGMTLRHHRYDLYGEDLEPVFDGTGATVGDTNDRDRYFLRGQALIVGVTTDDEPSDPDERAAIQRLAKRLDATVEYRRDEIHHQVKALEEGEIHLLAGHLPKTTPFAKEVGTTGPVSSMLLGDKRVKTVFALRKGENGFLMETEKAIGGAN